MVKINKYFIPYMCFLILIIGFNDKYIIAFLVILFHEFIHYITARWFNIAGFHIEILPFGTVLKLKMLDEATPIQDLIISMSGPIANISLAFIFNFFYKYYGNEVCHILYYCNLALGFFNLIPAFPLDGGRILRDMISFNHLYKISNMITVKISICIGVFLMFLYIFLFFSGVNNINIGLIAVLIIVSSIKEKERIVYIIMGDIIKKRYKFLKRGFIQNVSISVYCKKDLVSIMSIVEKGKYNIFSVLDDDMMIIKYISEEELIRGLKQYGNITVEDLIKFNYNNDF